MSDFIEKVKETLHGIQEKYYVELAYHETNSKGIEEVLDKNFLVYKDDTGDTEYTKDVAKATCFDFILGATIVKGIQRQWIADENMRASLISVADAHFINDLTGVIRNASENALTPQEQLKFKEVEAQVEKLSEIMKRVEGVNKFNAAITLGNGSKKPFIEISVQDIDVKARLFALKNDAAQTPLFLIDNSGNATYEGTPVSILISKIKE